ncbi:MAG: zf-HC2 domain-containing protein [Lachnospiraceae bacterium]|nr:zf-HC2 domain-containing protein [Lachnospiraceae bacterium]
MNCHKAEMMINDYLNETLSMSDLEAFIQHIRSCPACFEELETYVMIHYTLDVLDNDKVITETDFHKLLENDLARHEEEIANVKRRRRLFSFSIVLVEIIMVITLWLHYKGEPDKTLPQQIVTVMREESRFHWGPLS